MVMKSRNGRDVVAAATAASRARESEQTLATTPSVVLVEDHRLVREGTRELLDRDPTIRVVGEAASGEEALDLALELRPAIMLVDVQLREMSGIELIRRLAATSPDVRCIVLSAYDDYVYITEAFEAGAYGYLLKTVGAAELVGAVHAVAAGARVTDETVSKRLMQRWHPAPPAMERLTRREMEVLELLARGRSNKQMARELGVGLRTTEGYVSTLLAKCGVRSRTEAALFAVSHHLVAPPREEPPAEGDR